MNTRMTAAVLALGALTLNLPALSQLPMMRALPGSTIQHSDAGTQVQINQLFAEIKQLKAQLADDEVKLKATTQSANDNQIAIGLVNKGYDGQFKTLAGNLDKLTGDVVVLKIDHAGLKKSFNTHTHGYSKHSVGFTNVPLGGGQYASLIQKNVDSFVSTTPPQ